MEKDQKKKKEEEQFKNNLKRKNMWSKLTTFLTRGFGHNRCPAKISRADKCKTSEDQPSHSIGKTRQNRGFALSNTVEGEG
eukprot:14420374-Ditylum_brightwellii.AAC.1